MKHIVGIELIKLPLIELKLIVSLDTAIPMKNPLSSVFNSFYMSNVLIWSNV